MTDCRICIIEPDEIEREILVGILAENGPIEAFSNGKGFLETLNADRPCLVIMETEIDSEDGYEICQQIKNHCANCETSILFLSSKTSVEERLKGLQAGADDYLHKPYDVMEFASKIAAAKDRIDQSINLKQQLEFASSTAFQAMSAQSEMGVVLRSVRSMNEATDYQGAIEGLCLCLTEFELKGTIYYLAKDTDAYEPTPGRTVSPIEQEIITLVRPIERIWQKDARAAYNFPSTSVLVLNMPDDEEKAGRLRDSLCLLMEAFDVRIAALNNQQKLIDAQHWQDSVKEITTMLSKASMQLQESISVSNDTLRKLVDELNELLPRLGLEEDQEERINIIVDEAFDQFSVSMQKTDETRDIFGKVLSKLNQL